MLSLNPRNRSSASAMLTSPELQAKLQLDEIATSFGQRQQSEQVKDLMETIKVPSGNNLRRLGTVLPKPCYPDVRPNSPSSWTVAEQEKQRVQATPRPPLFGAVSTYVLPKAAETNRTADSTNSDIGVFGPKAVPRMPLASIPEASHNHNNPPRQMYSNIPNASQIQSKIGHNLLARPQQVRRFPAPQIPNGAPIVSHVRFHLRLASQKVIKTVYCLLLCIE
jgi:hypothetical protein